MKLGLWLLTRLDLRNRSRPMRFGPVEAFQWPARLEWDQWPLCVCGRFIR
jgi:hypothetical protein